MLIHYLKVACRNLAKHRALSFINIVGIALGMGFALLIGLWVQYEMSYDDSYPNKDRIAMVMKTTLFNGRVNTMESSPLPLHDVLKNDYPEVKRASRLTSPGSHSLVAGNNKFMRSGRYVDGDFLEMFSLPMLKGSALSALDDPNSIVISESMATALFGNEEPVGHAIRMDNEYVLKVSGVFKDVPANSTLNFDFLAPYQFVIDHNDWIKGNMNSWQNNFLMNIVELKPGASMEALSKKLYGLNMEKDKTIKNQTLQLHPMVKWHLYGDFKEGVNVGGKITYVRLFGMIGIFVLLIACINFMNLSTARSALRMKEVGVRKTLGGQRIDLVFQFLSESILIAGLAFLLSAGLVKLILPFLSNLGFRHIQFDLQKASLIGAALVLCLVTGLVAGSYPALYLSSFLPVKVLKGEHKQGKGAVTFRKVLVVSQFAISIGLIACTMVVFQQIGHARERSIGYIPNNLVTVDASRDLCEHYDGLKQDLLNSGYVESVARSSQPMTAVYNRWSDFSWDGKDPHADLSLDAIMADWDFGQTAGLTFRAGRPFSKAFSTDSNGVILNDAALKLIGYKDPIGRSMKSGDRVLTIVGIVDNVVLTDPFKTVSPLAILFNGSKTESVNDILFRLKAGMSPAKALAAIQPIFERYNPSMPFAYHFGDEEFARKFALEKQVGTLSGIFAGMAIFISCLGLFGLAMFMAERRNKEIGIRKVLGASVSGVVMLLSKEFLWLVLIACWIAAPVAYWLMQGWLEKYDYRINIGWSVFVLAGLGAIVIALLTVSVQAMKAALANPVRSLRSE